jgi:hypothetical protein
MTMKKYFIIISTVFLLLSFSSIKETDVNNVESHTETVECKIRQCNAIAKSTGKRCKHCVSNSEDKQCWQHKPKK